MARPVDTEKRAELAAKAILVLKKEGLQISTAALAERLEVKRPTLLYYFPTKASIIETALVDMFIEQVQYVVSAADQYEHPLDQLHAHIMATHAFHHGREDRIVFLTQAIATLGSEHTSRFIDIGNQAFDARRKLMKARLEEAIEAGTMHACDVDALIRMVRSTIDGLVVQRFMTGCELAPIHEFLWEHVLGPLKREPKE